MARVGTAWLNIEADLSQFKRQVAAETHKRITQKIHVEADTSSVRKARGDVDHFGASLRNAAPHADRLARATRGLVSTAAKITAVGIGAQAVSALGAAAVATTAALGPLAGAAGAMPALASAGGQALGTWKLAFSGVTTAVGGLNEHLDKNSKAFRELTPEGQRFAETLEGMKKPLRELSETSQKGLLPGLQRGLKSSMANFDILKRGVGDTAKVIGQLAEQAGKMLGSRGFGKDLETQMARNDVTIRRAGQAGLLLADALRHVVLAAGPLTDFITRNALAFAKTIDVWARGARESGQLARFFEETKRVMTTVVQIAARLGTGLVNIFKLAYPVGRDFLKLQADLAGKFERWTKSASGQNAIRKFFQDAKPAMIEAEKLVIAVVKEFGKLAQGASVAPILRMIRLELLPAFAKLVRATTASFGPPFIEALKQTIILFTKLGGASGPLVGFVVVLGKTSEILNKLIDTFPILGKAIVTAMAVGSIAKALGITTAISGMVRLRGQIALLNAAAAGTAPSGVMAAMAAGGIGPTRGGAAASTGRAAAQGTEAAVVAGSVAGWRGGLARAVPFLKAGLVTAVAGATLSGLVHAFDSNGLKKTTSNWAQDVAHDITLGAAKSSKDIAKGLARSYSQAIQGLNIGKFKVPDVIAPKFWDAKTASDAKKLFDAEVRASRLTRDQARALGVLADARARIDPLRRDLLRVAGIRIDFRRAIQWDPHQFAAMRKGFNLLEGAARGTSHTLGELRSTSQRNLRAIAATLGTNTADGRRAVQRNFELINQAITGDLRAGRISTTRYMRAIKGEVVDASHDARGAAGVAFAAITRSITQNLRTGAINSKTYMRGIRTQVKSFSDLSKNDAHVAFTALAGSIRSAMRSGYVSTKSGQALIHALWVKELKAYGISEADATRPEAGGSTTNPLRRKRGGRLFTGGIPNPGAGSGDDHYVIGPGGRPVAMISGTEEIVTRPQSAIANRAMAVAYQAGLVPYPSLDAMYGKPELQHRARGGPLRRFAGGGGLMGALPFLAPVAEMGRKYGLSVTSGLRPGSITSSGNTSWHSSGHALDISNGYATPQELAFARMLSTRFGRQLAELIHTPLGGGQIKNGRPYIYGGQVARDHYDHVHVALARALSGAGGGFDSTLGTIKRVFSKAKGWPGLASQKVLDTTRNAANQNLANAFSVFGGGDFGLITGQTPRPGHGVATRAQMVNWARIALQRTGIFPPTAANIESILTLARKESGWQVDNINLWDSNARAGNPSVGLMQVTLDKVGGSKARGFDPIQNIMASIRYQKSQYGHLVTFSPYGRGGRLRRLATGGRLVPAPGRAGLPIYSRVAPKAPSLPRSVTTAVRALGYAKPLTKKAKAAAGRAEASFKGLLGRLGRVGGLAQFSREQGVIGGLEHAVSLDSTYADAAGSVIDSDAVTAAIMGDQSWQVAGLPVDQQHAIQDRIIDSVLPRINGMNQLQWLFQQVADMANLRNWYLLFEKRLKDAVERIKVTLAAAERQLTSLTKQIATLKKRQQNLLTSAKHKGISRARVKSLKDEAAKVGAQVTALTREQTGAKKVVSTLTTGLGALRGAGGWIDHSSESVWGRLYQLAGPINETRLSSAQILASDATAPGQLVQGDMLGVLNAIRPFRKGLYQTFEAKTPDTPTGPSVDEWTLGLSQQALLRGMKDVTGLQTDVLRGIIERAPFGGSYATGGVVPGPAGAPRMILAHGGETVLRADQAAGTEVHIHFNGAARELERFLDTRIEQVTRDRSRHAGRQLPGSGRLR